MQLTMQIFMNKCPKKILHCCPRPRKGSKKHLNNHLMLKVKLIYLELLGFDDTNQSPFIVESFIVFFSFVVI